MASRTETSATPEQIEALVKFLDDHRDLALGRLRSLEGKVQVKKLWEELCSTLNSMGGCTKTVQQWQKVWFDTKHMAKKAAAASHGSALATGGGPSTAPLHSHWELKMLSITGGGFGEPQTGARVPAFNELNEPIPATSSQAGQPSLSQPIEIALPPELGNQSEQQIELGQPSVQESSSSIRSSQLRRPRRRRLVSGMPTDVRSRLFLLEEERIEQERVRNRELAGIRTALQELVELFGHYLER